MISTPWAILLCKFNDDSTEPFLRQRYDEIFTPAGTGKWNMVDYFRDMSHGILDLSGSRVFGWLEIDRPRSAYAGDRKELKKWVRQAAADNSIDLSGFFSIVAVFNVQTDLFGGPEGVVTDHGALAGRSGLSPSLLGQEMGHAYGLRHSRENGSLADYRDPWDVMSTLNGAFMTPHPFYQERDIFGAPTFLIGPGLNAANMWGRGWLDQARVWTDSGSGDLSTSVRLRPLHRRDLPGFLAARFGSYFIEYRNGSGWDEASDPAVFVHLFEGDHSYLVSNNDGDHPFVQGSGLSTPPELSIFGSGMSISVAVINQAEEYATIRLGRTKPQIPREWPIQGPFYTPWIKWLENEYLVIGNQLTTSISAKSPLVEILRQITIFESAGTLVGTGLDEEVRLRAAARIAELGIALEGSLRFRSPAPSAHIEREAGADAASD